MTAQEVHEALMRRRRREQRETFLESFEQRRHPLPDPPGLKKESAPRIHIGNPEVVITNRPPGLQPVMISRLPYQEICPRGTLLLQEPVRKPQESDYAWKARLRKYERLLKAVT